MCSALFIFLAVLLVLLFAWYVYSIQMSTRGMPPGPFVVPILGSYPAVWWRKPHLKIWKEPLWEHINSLAKEFGDIIGGTVLNFDIVFLTSHEVLTEVANMDEYSQKFSHKLYTYPRTFGKELGILAVSSPPIWTEMRKFTIRTLREFGFGKEYTMHGVITAEAHLLVENFKKKMARSNGRVTFHNTFTLTLLNVLWSMVAGVRYDHDDPTLLKIMDSVFKFSKTYIFSNPFELLLPYLNNNSQKFLGMDLRQKGLDACHEVSERLINQRKATGNYLTEPENYIDVFLQKIHYNKNSKDSVYSMEQLQSMVADLLLVGTLTVDSTLEYAILFLTIHPEVQRKCRDEIDSVVGLVNDPTEVDITKMPYFQAFVLEVHRFATVVPNPIPRIVPKDWNLRGYRIPKDTIVFANSYSINRNNKIWGDADNFRPERFINERGEYVPDPRVTAFGFGKRICFGINFVNSVVPLFLATLLQKFTFSVIPDSPPSEEAEIGITLSPKEFQVQVALREAVPTALNDEMEYCDNLQEQRKYESG